MKKYFKILVYSLVLTISTVIVLVVIGFAIEDKLVSYTVEYVKESSPFPLKIGSTKVSLLKNFPNASVILKDVNVTSPSKKTNEYIELQEIQINFGLLGVFSNKFRINNVVFKTGRVKISMSKYGSDLINPFLTSESASGNTNWLVSIGSLSLENVEVDFSNSITNWNVKTLINKSEIKGFIESKGYSFSIKLRAFVKHFAQGEFIYLTNKQVDVSTSFNSANSYYTAQRGLLSIDGITLNFSAKIGQVDKLPINIVINGNNIDTETFLRLISQQNIQLPKHFSTKGNISLNANISGTKGSTTPFDINVSFNTERFIFYIGNYGGIIIESLNGRFISSANSTSIETKFRKINYGESNITGRLMAKRLSSPIVFFSGETNINLSDLNSISSSMPELSGLIQGKIEFLVEIKDPLKPNLSDLSTLKSEGNFDLFNFSMKIKGRELNISDLSGNVTLRNQAIENFSFKGSLNNSAINCEIFKCNLVPFIVKAEPLNIMGKISADMFNTEWLMISELNNISNIVESKNDYEIGTISGLVSVKSLRHKKFSSQLLSANATIYSNRYIFENLKGTTCSGTFNGRLAVDAHSSNKQVVAGEIDAVGVEISTLFNSFDSFGQSVVTEKNISGKLTGKSSFVSQLNDWNFDLSTLKMNSNVSVADGKLEGIKQLEGLSNFISLDELRSISFKNLENSIIIDKGEVIIPKMEVKSSVMDFVCSGKHRVNGTYNYNVALKLSDILFRKASKINPKNAEFGEIEPDGTGNTKLHLKIDDFGQGMNVSYDRQAAREGLKTTIKNEKELIKQAFREEFGSIFKKTKDSVVTKKNTNFKLNWADSTINKGDSTIHGIQKTKEESKKTKFEIDWDDN